MTVNAIMQSCRFCAKHIEELTTCWLSKFDSANSGRCICAIGAKGMGVMHLQEILAE